MPVRSFINASILNKMAQFATDQMLIPTYGIPLTNLLYVAIILNCFSYWETPLSNTRDDFTEATKRMLSDRVNGICSAPTCNKSTKGPSGSSTDAMVSIGVAAHICAAAEGGPRYDPTMSQETRKSIDNGIWLCCNHARMIDVDPGFYTVQRLQKWKREAEKRAAAILNRKPIPSREVVVSINDLQRLNYFSGIYSSLFRDNLKTERFRAKVPNSLIDTLTIAHDKRDDPRLEFVNEELEQMRQELISAVEAFMDHFKQQSGGGEDYYDYIDLNEMRRKYPESVDKFADMIDKTRELAIEVGNAAVKFAKFSSGLCNLKGQTDTKLLVNYPY